jgi:hypothetical protein
VEDCRAATVKAMPTYGKKEYIPIYVVTSRSYIWIDSQNICDINQKPEPLLSGTHDEWRHLVVDTGAPRRRTFLSLGWEMLDISDRLHIMVSFLAMPCIPYVTFLIRLNNIVDFLFQLLTSSLPKTGCCRKSTIRQCLEGVCYGG